MAGNIEAQYSFISRRIQSAVLSAPIGFELSSEIIEFQTNELGQIYSPKNASLSPNEDRKILEYLRRGFYRQTEFHRFDNPDLELELSMVLNRLGKRFGVAAHAPKKIKYPFYGIYQTSLGLQDFRLTTPYGVLPNLVVDQTNRIFAVENVFFFTQDSGYKFENVLPVAEDGQDEEDKLTLPKLDVVMRRCGRTVPPTTEDLENINNLLDQVEIGIYFGE